jgi:hypothetical protein
VETEAVTTVANAWDTLTFDFANPVSGPPLNLDYDYNKLIIFFNFGATGAAAGAQTYYFDDVAFIGGGGLPSGPFNDLSFDSPGVVYTLTGFGGAEDSSLQPDPTNGTNTVVRVNRSATAETFAGTVVSTGPNLTVGTIPFTATNTRMTVRVWSPDAGIRVLLKLEDATSPGCPNSCTSVETEAVTTVARGWETLTFDFANGTPALNLSYNYDRLIIFFNFGVSGATAGAQTFYFDDVLFVTGGGGGGGGALAFASNYSQVDPSNWTSIEGGAAGAYIDDSVPTLYWWNGFAPNDATPSFYFGYGISTNARPWGFGAFVRAPGNGTANVTGKTNLRIAVWGNDELMNTGPTLTLILKGPSVGGCTSELLGTVSVAAPGVQNYTVALNTFTLQTACGYASPAEALAAGVAEVHVQVLGDNVQYVTGNPADFPNFPNGLNIGPISFN